jgi:hypothetical protein
MTDEELIQRFGSQHTNVIDDLKPCPTCGAGSKKLYLRANVNMEDSHD